MKRAAALLTAVVVAATPLGAQGEAQDALQGEALGRRPALVIAGPATVGLQIPLSARLTLRPDLSITRTTFNVSGNESKFVNLGLGLGLLVRLGQFDGMHTYVAPRVAISRSTFDDGSTSDLWFFDAAFGVSAPVTKRLAIFGEVGPRVTYSDQSTSTVENRTTNLVARSALGVTFAF